MKAFVSIFCWCSRKSLPKLSEYHISMVIHLKQNEQKQKTFATLIIKKWIYNSADDNREKIVQSRQSKSRIKSYRVNEKKIFITKTKA
jgi:hypothetical protein